MLKTLKFLGAAAVWMVLSLVPAGAQDTGGLRMSVSREGTVKEVLDLVCEKIDGSLLVRSTDVDLSRRVSIHMKDATVNEILGRIFDGTGVRWTISGKQVQIYKPQAQEQKTPTRTVGGTIVDENGEPVIGAAVILDGTRTAATTDIDGHWSLTVPQSARSLRIACMGYEDQWLSLDSAKDYTMTLKEDISLLDESVVVGYGVQKKSVVTAAISSVKGEQLSGIAPTRVDNVLKGMVSGVTITPSSGTRT